MKDSSVLPLGQKLEFRVKQADVIALGTVAVVLGFFAIVPGALAGFKYLSKEYAYLMSFVKFGVLATFGECLALRIVAGTYNREGFGVLPKMIVWGLLGIVIKLAFVIFATGAPHALVSLGFAVDPGSIQNGDFGSRLVTALSISVSLNLIFAPVMMTLHKITDLHIQEGGGKVAVLFTPIDIAGILQKIDWQVMYHFVYKKTLPLFWIPAHTITFLLPGEFQILFAAVLGIALGLILAFASGKKK